MKKFTLILSILIWVLMLECTFASNNKRIVCFHGTWSHYRQGNGNFKISDVDPSLCTHYIYSFAGLSDLYKIRSLDPWLDVDLGGYRAAVDLRLTNPDLKVLLAVGGWNEGSSRYSKMASQFKRRRKFINSAVDLLLQYGFDGLDLDWEYPARRGGVPADKQNFVKLLSEMRKAFNSHGLLLTIAVGMAKDLTLDAYDIPLIANYLDFINLMTYDLRGPWDGVAGHHTQLYPAPSDQGYSFYLNLEQSVKLWTDSGIPKSKLNLGMAFYGRTYAVPSNDGSIGSPSIGAGLAGPYTSQAGFIGYNELCEKMLTESWQINSNPFVAAPWAYKGIDWVAYDNVTSITEKSVWGNNLGLGGGMVWSIETDDFLGLCGGGKFPLLRAMNAIWRGQAPAPKISSTVVPTTATTPIHTTKAQETTQISTTPIHITSQRTTQIYGIEHSTVSSLRLANVEGGYCDMNTYVAPIVNPADCRSFMMCAPAKEGIGTWVSIRCGARLFYNEVFETCDYTSSGGCVVP